MYLQSSKGYPNARVTLLYLSASVTLVRGLSYLPSKCSASLCSWRDQWSSVRYCFSAAEPREDWDQASAREFPQRLRRQESLFPSVTIPPAKQAKLNFLKLQLCKRNVLRLDMSAVISIENFRVSPTIILKLGQVFTKSLIWIFLSYE